MALKRRFTITFSIFFRISWFLNKLKKTRFSRAAEPKKPQQGRENTAKEENVAPNKEKPKTSQENPPPSQEMSSPSWEKSQLSQGKSATSREKSHPTNKIRRAPNRTKSIYSL